MGEQISYEDLLASNQISEFREFVNKYLVQQSSRLTIELFAEEVHSEEAEFVLNPNLTLNHRGYEVVTLEQIKMMKSQY